MTPIDATRVRRVLSCAVALIVISASFSKAAADQNKKQARVLFRQGNRLFAAKRYEEALAKFQAARELFPSYKIDLNIASTLSELGKLPEAARYYEGFLRRGWEKAPPAMVKGAREKLDELKAKLGAIDLKCKNDGAAVTLDGERIGQTPISERIYVKPGPHQLVLAKEGFERHLETMVLAAGQSKELAIMLKEIVAPAPTPEPTLVPTPPIQKEDSGASNWKKTAGWVALGVGGAAIVTGVIFSALAASKKSEYEDFDNKLYGDQQREDPDGTKLGDLESEFDRYKAGAIVGFVIGGVAAAAGAGLLVWHYRGGGAATDSEHAQITPLVGPGTVGASSTFRF